MTDTPRRGGAKTRLHQQRVRAYLGIDRYVAEMIECYRRVLPDRPA